MDSLTLVAIGLAVLAVAVTVIVLRRRQDSSFGRVPLTLDDPASRPPAPHNSTSIASADLAEIGALVAGGNKIAAIKRVRELTGLGLKEAKDYVEAMPSGGPPLALPRAGSAPPAGAGDLAEVHSLAHHGRKIEAIKRYRELTGVGLKEAKDFVDRL